MLFCAVFTIHTFKLRHTFAHFHSFSEYIFITEKTAFSEGNEISFWGFYCSFRVKDYTSSAKKSNCYLLQTNHEVNLWLVSKTNKLTYTYLCIYVSPNRPISICFCQALITSCEKWSILAFFWLWWKLRALKSTISIWPLEINGTMQRVLLNNIQYRRHFWNTAGIESHFKTLITVI